MNVENWMLFVDGENFTIEGEKIAQEKGIELIEGSFYEPGVFLWLPTIEPVGKGKGFATDDRHYDCPSIWVRGTAIRAHYFTTFTGNDEKSSKLKMALRKIEFTPHLFKRNKQTNKQKGLDISLATELLTNAFMKNFDVVVLIAGDADYLPLIEQVKRLGRSVIVSFFDKPGAKNPPIHPDLKLAADGFCDITQRFIKGWNQEKNRVEK